MPKRAKDRLKKIIAQANNDINRAGANINAVEAEFRPVHPELADGLVAALSLLVSTQDVINKFGEVAWGMTEPNWDSYLSH